MAVMPMRVYTRLSVVNRPSELAMRMLPSLLDRLTLTCLISEETSRAAALALLSSAALRLPGTSMGSWAMGWMLVRMEPVRFTSTAILPLPRASAALRAAVMRPLSEVSLV